MTARRLSHQQDEEYRGDHEIQYHRSDRDDDHDQAGDDALPFGGRQAARLKPEFPTAPNPSLATRPPRCTRHPTGPPRPHDIPAGYSAIPSNGRSHHPMLRTAAAPMPLSTQRITIRNFPNPHQQKRTLLPLVDFPRHPL
jgi:hypothetical protein